MRKQAPFLKIYSEYTNNYKQATALFEECQRKKRSFDEIVRRLEVNIELVCLYQIWNESTYFVPLFIWLINFLYVIDSELHVLESSPPPSFLQEGAF